MRLGKFGEMVNFWNGKKVFITGHTGFKGSWLSLWLQNLGAKVIGYSLKAPSNPSLFDVAKIADDIESIEGNILDSCSLQTIMSRYKPDIVIHMAAQSLVRQSYQDPITTLSTNIMGTANLLEAMRQVDSVQVAICITSDKCYENREWVWGYRENEAMGGYDPYSCSKGCAELVISSYRRSFFSNLNSVQVASARAGNVIGGGDWAIDRIIPDSVRALVDDKPITLRNPSAIRPWQHVLEPLTGYLLLAQKLWSDDIYADGWNFGPDDMHAWSVGRLVDEVCKIWGEKAEWKVLINEKFHEAQYLKLDSSKAKQRLGWKPMLNMEDTLNMTIEWYKRYYNGDNPRQITLEQIVNYQSLLKENK